MSMQLMDSDTSAGMHRRLRVLAQRKLLFTSTLSITA